MKKSIAVGGLAMVIVIAMSVSKEATSQQFISIGTGGLTGVYYPSGGAICLLVNRKTKEHGIRCIVEPTGGSVYNINTVRAGELEFGFAQSDMQHHSFHGTSTFIKEGPFEKERAIFSAHPDSFTLVARKGTNISEFTDLKGKRFNVGNRGSGQRATTEVVMKAYGMTMDDFSLAVELKGSEMSQALCDGKIDAMVYVVGHFAAAIAEATTTCDVELIDVTGEEIDKLIEENSHYRQTTIPGGMYSGNEADVTTFGVIATLISSAHVSEEVVYTLVKSVFESFDEFKKFHPAFKNLIEAEMVVEGLSAPLHDGAAKYYKERGFIQ